MVVQYYYNRVGVAGGWGGKRMMDSHNKALKMLCSYYVTAICKFALLMYMSEFCCYVLLNF